MESLRRADLSLLEQRRLSTQERAQSVEKAVDTMTPRRLPFIQPMSMVDRSNSLRYGEIPDSKYPSPHSKYGPEDVQKKVAPGTRVESLDSHEASRLPPQGWDEMSSQMMAMDLKHRRDLKPERKLNGPYALPRRSRYDIDRLAMDLETHHLTSPESGAEGLVLRESADVSCGVYDFGEGETRKVGRSGLVRKDTARHGNLFRYGDMKYRALGSETQSNGEGDPVDLDLSMADMSGTQKVRVHEIGTSPYMSIQMGSRSGSDYRKLHPGTTPYLNTGRQSPQTLPDSDTDD